MAITVNSCIWEIRWSGYGLEITAVNICYFFFPESTLSNWQQYLKFSWEHESFINQQWGYCGMRPCPGSIYRTLPAHWPTPSLWQYSINSGVWKMHVLVLYLSFGYIIDIFVLWCFKNSKAIRKSHIYHHEYILDDEYAPLIKAWCWKNTPDRLGWFLSHLKMWFPKNKAKQNKTKNKV